MKKSLLLLASFAGLVACFGEKKDEPTAGQTTTETCPAETAPAPVAAESEKKVEEPAVPATTEVPAEKPAQ
jgi:ABC-type glycerol-3-phosphate transport system substrate-binding protein